MTAGAKGKAFARRSGYLVRVALAATVLGLLWVVWQPSYFTLPEELTRPRSRAELAALPPGSLFLIEGRVEPRSSMPGLEWQGRFAYLHRQFKDVGIGTKEQRVVVIAQHRPALAFVWTDGEVWQLPTDSYELKHAPRVKARFWPRKWLGTTRVDDWHESSTGFRAGEAALAYGRVGAAGGAQVEMLLESPVSVVEIRIGRENTARQRLVLAAKIMLSLFSLSLIVPRWRKNVPTPVAV